MWRFLRKIHRKFFGSKKHGFFNPIPPTHKGQTASDFIYNYLIDDAPCMISRMGNTEFSCVYLYKIKHQNYLKRKWAYITGKIDNLNYTEEMKYKIQHNAGFFPATENYLDRFSEMMLKDITNIDVLGSIISLENEFIDELKDATRIGFEDLNAYNHKNPWTKALAGKRVLIIHPFVATIEQQYKKRDLLFEDKDMLPEFTLLTYLPVQSIAGNFKSLPYASWFEALESMKKDISVLDFDIAILGCGAYGLPLASFIKESGRKAVHIGGATQILFGIMGRRWETEYDLSHLVNEHWTRPVADEIPKNFKDVEEGCYW